MTSEAKSSALEQEEPTTVSSEPTTIKEKYSTTLVDTTIVETTETTTSQKTIKTTEKEKETTIITNKNNYNYNVPSNQNGFKSWMPHSALSKSSPNYKMITQLGHVDEYGLWKIDNYYCVALGSYYSTRLGDIFEIELSSGNIFKVITADHKADAHTDFTHRYTVANGCIAEFIVSKQNLSYRIKTAGSVGTLSEFSGTYVRITKLGNIYDN